MPFTATALIIRADRFTAAIRPGKLNRAHGFYHAKCFNVNATESLADIRLPPLVTAVNAAL